MQTRPSGKPREDDPDSLVGEVLADRYRIEEPLGMGGIGAVFRAHDVKLDRDVAVKVLLPAFVAYDELRLRFDREARALAALSHPHVVPISDYGFQGEAPYLVMELLEGRTLGETLEDEGALDLDRSLAIARQVLGALAYAHGKGLIHRDLKPGNVFLQSFPGSEDHVRILDFGLAKFLIADRHAGLTRMGEVFGTPAYMAPEQAAGSTVDERVDVYAAGILLFEMLTGRKAFDGEPGEVLRKQLVEPMAHLQSLSDHPMAEALDRLLQRATRKLADERYRHAGEMLAALDVLSGRLSLGRAPTLLAQPAVRTPTIPRLRTEDGGPKTTPWAGHAAVSASSTSDPTLRSIPPPRRATPLLLLAAAAVVLLSALVGAAAALVLFGGDGDAVPAPNPAPIAPPPAPPPATRRAGTELPPDPWAAPPLDAFYAAARSRLDRGETLSESSIGELRRRAREQPDDPRPLLLLARCYVAQGFRSDGLDRYERAVAVDAGARGDPQMLRDVVALVAHDAVGARASSIVADVYGAEALPEVDRLLGREDLSAQARRRATELRSALR